MDRKEFLGLIQTCFTWLEEEGYEFSHIETSVTYQKVESDCSQAISFHWGEYNNMLVFNIAANKAFNNIESIISNFSGYQKDYTIKKIWNKIDKVEDYKTISIGNKNDVENFSRIVKEFYKSEAMPFFDKFTDLNKVSTWLELNKNHADLLVVNQNLQMVRTLVIFKECNSDRFEELYKRFESFLQDQQKSSPYKDIYQTFLKFKPYFDTKD